MAPELHSVARGHGAGCHARYRGGRSVSAGGVFPVAPVGWSRARSPVETRLAASLSADKRERPTNTPVRGTASVPVWRMNGEHRVGSAEQSAYRAKLWEFHPEQTVRLVQRT